MSDLRSVMNIIEKNHASMKAQVEKLTELTPECSTSEVFEGDRSVAVSNLLSASMFDHLQGAARTLQALAEVERNCNMKQASEPTTDKEGDIIDIEATPIDKEA